MADTVRVAVVGAGYIGSIHARTIARIQEEHPHLASLEYIVDVDYARAKKLASQYHARPAGSLREIAGNVDLAIVATPTQTHRRVVEELHEAGVPGALVEKPLAGGLEDAAAIVGLAGDMWISVGHSERFNPAMDGLARAYRLLGLSRMSLVSVETRRVGPFVERARSVDVVHDLATHDIDVILSVTGEMPARVYAAARRGIVTGLPDLAEIVMEFDGTVAVSSVNRITPVKERRGIITFHGGEGHAVVDLDFITGEVRVYTSEGMVKPGVEGGQPIYREDLAVLESFRTGGRPPVSVQESFTVLQICDMALRSSREARIVDSSEYSEYRGIVEEGIEGYKRFKAGLTG